MLLLLLLLLFAGLDKSNLLEDCVADSSSSTLSAASVKIEPEVVVLFSSPSLVEESFKGTAVGEVPCASSPSSAHPDSYIDVWPAKAVNVGLAESRGRGAREARVPLGGARTVSSSHPSS